MRLAASILFSLLTAGAIASPLQTAIENREIAELESWQGDGAERDVARGAALSLRHQDGAALSLLEPLMRTGTTAELRAAAALALADIYLRQTRYDAAHDALAAVETETGKALAGEPRQILQDTAALLGEKPMTITRAGAGSLKARRDRAGLIRLPVAVNGHELSAVIDTDASFSVVGQSTAETLGLRILPPTLHVVTTSRPDQPMHLAIADRLLFGDTEFSHVLFAVLPDKAVQFGPDYRMEAVIGLPILVGLHRIRFDNDGRTLRYGSGEAMPGATPNLLLSGLDPFVLVESGHGRLRLALDTAADKTSLSASAFEQDPQLGDGASEYTATWQGAGGSARDGRAHLLREWRFAIGGAPVVLHRIAVLSAREPDRDGALGLDALKSARAWVIDFDAMVLRLEN